MTPETFKRNLKVFNRVNVFWAILIGLVSIIILKGCVEIAELSKILLENSFFQIGVLFSCLIIFMYGYMLLVKNVFTPILFSKFDVHCTKCKAFPTNRIKVEKILTTDCCWNCGNKYFDE